MSEVIEVKELYGQILTVQEPGRIGQVELDVREELINAKAVRNEEIHWPCSECGELLTVYNHTLERVWRYLDTCQFKTYFPSRKPRVKCPVHGGEAG